MVLNQPASAITCLWMLMTFIPAAVSLLAVIIVYFYPLTTARMEGIVGNLRKQRGNPAATEQEALSISEDPTLR